MTFVVFTFLITLVVVLTSYWLFVVRPETSEKTSMVSRLQGVRDQIKNVSVANAPARLSHIPALDAALKQREHTIAPLQQLIDRKSVV